MPQIIPLSAYSTPIFAWIRSHKLWATILAIAIIGGGWWAYARAASTTGVTHYILGTVSSSTIISTISGSGQVSPSDQVDIKPKQSGDITAVLVKQGDTVREGQALAYIDATDAQKSVRDAKANLESAQISLAKLKEPPTTLTLTQAQNALSGAQDAITKQYADGQTDIINAFLDLPDIITGLQGIETGTNTNTNQQWNIDYYVNAISNYEIRAKAYRDTAYTDYINAKSAYDTAFADYQAMGNTPDQATVDKLLNETYNAVNLAAKATKSANAFIQLYEDTIKNHNLTPSTVSDTSLTSLNGYTGKLNTHLSTLLSDTDTIKSDKQSLTEKQQSLEQTQAGADSLDLQSAELNVTKAQNSLTDAQNTLNDYTVRAPFAGTLAKVDANKGDTASPSTAIATIITKDQIADLSLNEVDAAKVKVGQKVTLTFDAIDGLTIAGSVASVDTLGTVSQGVVSYDVKIDFTTQDSRVKPGMTVNANIIIDTAQDTLAVPTSAVKSLNGESYVQVFTPPLSATGATTGEVTSRTPQNVPVTTGISDDTNIQILSGLTPGEQIVVRTTSGTVAASGARTTTGASGGATRGGNAGFGGGAVLRGI